MQLAISLYRLANERIYSTLGDLFGVAKLTASVIFNQVRYWFQLFTTDLFTQPETEPNGSMNFKASLKTGNFHAW